jgi:5-methyltetrahydrofolate--homocysteine methyltransferase
VSSEQTIGERRAALGAALSERILCLDGATGTGLEGAGLSPEAFGGPEYEGCNEALVLHRPDAVLHLHRTYLTAGADIVETNTFGGTPLVLAEYPPLQEHAYAINRDAAALARQACAEFGAERWVAGSMGPTTKAISVTGGITFDELIEHFSVQARGLLDGGADYLLLETCPDTRNVKAGLLAIEALARARGERIPVAVSGTIEPTGTMLAGQTAEALWVSVSHVDLLYIGLNCATGPEFMADHLRALSEVARTRVACVPNAGLPDEDGNYPESPAHLAATVGRFVDSGWLNLVGGCCGTRPEHVTALAERVRGATPREIPRHRRAFYSGIDAVEATEDNRPLMVGERTNVIGSRRFKRLIATEQFERAAEIGRAQVKRGAQVVDVCLANPDRDERADMEAFLAKAIGKIRAPLMIDSTDPEVVEHALTWCQGKAIINSVNLEEGEERLEAIVPLARRYGAALVVGCIDEQGMASTVERKVEVALRSAELLATKFGVPHEDLIIDPLVFPCATGDTAYLGSAAATVEGVRRIKAALPDVRTILGISNVSFGLPPAGREVVNSVFLHECTKAGLDLAIVNTQKLQRHASIPPDEIALAQAVLFESTDASIAAFADRYRDAKPARPALETMSPDERLTSCIVEGTKEGLVAALDSKLEDGTPPLDIVNGPLMAGMDEVGRLFADNRLIVAEVLQSAEAMKAAVDHLEPHMSSTDAASRGTVVLATVRGDVHDIGKNLVEIILANNGYRVIDLGIKVPTEELVRAVREHDPDILGLSGLLVRSARMMVAAAEDLTAAGCTPDLLVGGAALSRRFTRTRIAPAYGGHVLYARDAMSGLALAGRLLDDEQRPGLLAGLDDQADAPTAGASKARGSTRPTRALPATVLDALPQPPDFAPHRLDAIPVDEVWRWVNPKMLYGRHLGFKGDFAAALAAGDERAERLHETLEAIRVEARAGRMTVRATWRWLEAAGDGEVLHLYEQGEPEPTLSWTVPRSESSGRALTDWVRPAGHPGPRDAVALFAVTAGHGVRGWANQLKEQGSFLASHAVQALALETAEAAAEYLHARLRAEWGMPDEMGLTMEQRFKARYAGRRYSPGYAACPDLAMQRGFWRLLEPGRIGIELTEELMMDPEASVSALVLHHPEAKYLS